MSNNPPYATIELTQEQHEFLLRNCDTNMEFALNAMMVMQEESTLRGLVDLNEKFRDIRDLLKKAVT